MSERWARVPFAYYYYFLLSSDFSLTDVAYFLFCFHSGDIVLRTNSMTTYDAQLSKYCSPEPSEIPIGESRSKISEREASLSAYLPHAPCGFSNTATSSVSSCRDIDIRFWRSGDRRCQGSMCVAR